MLGLIGMLQMATFPGSLIETWWKILLTRETLWLSKALQPNINKMYWSWQLKRSEPRKNIIIFKEFFPELIITLTISIDSLLFVQHTNFHRTHCSSLVAFYNANHIIMKKLAEPRKRLVFKKEAEQSRKMFVWRWKIIHCSIIIKLIGRQPTEELVPHTAFWHHRFHFSCMVGDKTLFLISSNSMPSF